MVSKKPPSTRYKGGSFKAVFKKLVYCLYFTQVKTITKQPEVIEGIKA